MAHATPLPAELASRETRVVRPRDGKAIYTHPNEEFARLERAGLLRRLAHGYYLISPAGRGTDLPCLPPIEAIALGIAVADYGRAAVALTGIGASRVLGALPRAISVSVVSIPVRRPPVETAGGAVAFWHRSVKGLDLQKARTELAQGWTTTPEQTLLDLADRPNAGGLAARVAVESMWALAARADWHRVRELSDRQRRPSAYSRAAWVCEGIVQDAPAPAPLRRPVPSKGLTSWSDAEPAAYGISG